MNPSTDDPDDLVRKKIDLNHITKMSYQMHVPDSITVGPNRSTFPRLDQDNDRVAIRMEVPDRLRPGGNGSMIMLNDTDFFLNDDANNLSNSFIQQPSLPSTLHPADIQNGTEEDFSSNHIQQPIKQIDPYHLESPIVIDDKQILNKFQLLQNRVRDIERTLARRQARDRIFYTCVIGYFFLQALLSVRRSMLN